MIASLVALALLWAIPGGIVGLLAALVTADMEIDRVAEEKLKHDRAVRDALPYRYSGPLCSGCGKGTDDALARTVGWKDGYGGIWCLACTTTGECSNGRYSVRIPAGDTVVLHGLEEPK